MKSDIANKSATKYLNPNVLKLGSCHHLWSLVRDNVHDSKRAQIKCRLLTGTYIFHRAVFNQHAMSPACQLCSIVPRDQTAFYQ